MKIENLKAGQSFKNYKEMCLELGMEIKSSTNSKNAQYKELAQYCKFTKSGHKITIDELYETPIQKEDNRGKSEGSRNQKVIYNEMVQLLIADLLAQCKSSRLSISRSRLSLAINMINENYGVCGENVKNLSKFTDIEEAVIYEFYNRSNGTVKNAIESGLKSLMDKRVIWYDTVTKVSEKTTHIKRLATSKEKEIIMTCERKVLDNLRYKTMSQVRSSKHWKLFKSEVKELLHKESQIDFYYFAYEINVHEEYLQEERKDLLKMLLDDEKRCELKGQLNATVYYHLIENAKVRQEKLATGKFNLYRLNDNYITNIRKLAQLLIDENSNNIVERVLNIKLDDNSLSQADLDEIEFMEMFS